MPEKLESISGVPGLLDATAMTMTREDAEMDPVRRNMLVTAAAATAAAAVPQVFAQQAGQAGAATSFYEKGNVRIRYQEIGSGFPLLVTPGGGLNSRINNWQTAVFNAMEEYKNDFRCITMDQRNATGGESTGPVPVDDPWGAFADDQLGLMDHLGIRQFFFMGYCIGGPFALKLIERAPDRVVAAVLCQPVGHRPENPDVMYNLSRDVWAKEFLTHRPEVSTETIEKYLHNLYRVRPDFVYSVSRDFVRNCKTPMLVLPDDTPAHAYQASVDVASLAPNAEVTVYPWKEPPELKARTINRVRTFLKAHQPAVAAR
jgi:pimeloyl-ACP methyl ester carboxylesterase